MRPVSAKRRKRDAVYADRRVDVYQRADGRCEAMAGMFCTGRCETVHHIAGRGGPDPHALDGLLGVCAPCHRYIHDHPAESYDRGWMASRLFSCPVCASNPGAWCPACDGTTRS